MNILCALIYAFAVSVSEQAYALAAASVLPVILVFSRRVTLIRLLRLNVINLIMLLTLALTWPEVREGFRVGLVIALRVNMIYIVFAALVFPQGLGAVYSLPLPEKLRVLLLLTLRGIYILRDSLDMALISAGLRAPEAGLVMRLKIFAYVLGSSLLRSSDRSERMMLAVESRGGFRGFAQAERVRLGVKSRARLMASVSYCILVVMMNYA